MIEGVLEQLTVALDDCGVRGAGHRRVLAEARDHLAEAVARVSEEEAVHAFGSPRELAELVAAELATAATRSAALAAFAVLGVAGAAYAVLFLTLPLAGLPDIFGGRVPGLGVVLFSGVVFAPQIAFVSGCLALIRVVRLRHRGALGSSELRLQRRRAGVALAAGFGTFASLGLAALDYRNELAAWWVVGSLAASTVFALSFSAVAVVVVRSARPRTRTAQTTEDVFDDLAPLFGLPALRRLELPGHPWRFAGLVALAAAMPVVLGGVVDGDPYDGLLRAASEMVAVLGCFALLGRLLGLRRL